MHIQAALRGAARSLTSDELAIVRTVVYSSLFDYPLTASEVRQSLLHASLDEDAIERTYDASPPLRQLLDRRDGYFFPRDRPQLVERRRARERTSRRVLGAHARLLRCVCAVPFTRLVALSGSAAHLNMDERADVDVFILTRGRRVWSVTLAVVVLARLFRQRQTLCLNFVLADDSPHVTDQDLFTANQIIHLKPLVGDAALEAFAAANPFVAAYYPAARVERASFTASLGAVPGAGLRGLKTALEAALSFGGGALAEAIARTLFGRYLRRRLANCASPDAVKLSPDCLKLHGASHRDRALQRFEHRTHSLIGTLRAGD